MADEELILAQRLARRLREAIEASSLVPWVSLRCFPNGACSDASLLLAKFLAENGLSGFRCVAAIRGDVTHAWLERGELIVDITGDQFEDMDEPVFVGRHSPWHGTFTDREERSAAIEDYDDHTKNYLLSAYQRITSALDGLA